MQLELIVVLCFVILSKTILTESLQFTKSQKNYYRDKVKSMFYHAYNGYLNYAYPLDELKPLSCTGMDTWGSFSLTLIDSLDTLLVMGNETEFIRASNLILNSIKVDSNVNVSVFETNIRVVGGLLSAHLLSGRDGWPCSGPLLRLAERFAQKLLPAFNTDTGMPYGTVNLKYGVHKYETPITCTAGVGTMILEFGTLSKLTGEQKFAQRALDALWDSRSSLGLVGNHINVQNGEWTATDAGIGAGIDSYFEYLAKGALLFQRPKLMQQFNEFLKSVNRYVRKEDWFVWVSMMKGQVLLPIFQSLETFWPGILTLTGHVADAQRILLQYSHIVRQYGFLPEFYNLLNQETVKKRSGYPLRPEFIESVYYLYRATKDPWLLQLAADVITAIDYSCRTSCGFATIKDVNDHSVEDRMESFFLSETAKYLYLIFDEDNFINNDGTDSRVIDTPNGPCVLYAGGYIFNTEAHPLDPGALYCCSAKRHKDLRLLKDFDNQINFMELVETPIFSNGFFDPLSQEEVFFNFCGIWLNGKSMEEATINKNEVVENANIPQHIKNFQETNDNVSGIFPFGIDAFVETVFMLWFNVKQNLKMSFP
uniref:alpha-1,2-Mannosidase n=1 Tax=Syphacia muris TaxID=451379 RepID=A0A0N5ARZ6_9BILA